MIEANEITGAITAWLLDTLAKPFIQSLAEDTRAKWKEFQWPDAERRYRDKLTKDYGRVPVIGFGEMELDDIFTDVYILDRPSAYLPHDIMALHKMGADYFRKEQDFRVRPQERHDGLALVTEGQNLYILGKPGAGKTTFLKHVTVNYARYDYDADGYPTVLPIFISLHEWATSNKPDLLDFIVQRFDICGFPDALPFVDYLLGEGKALLLFDGLDEVRQEGGDRESLIQQLKDFIRKYDECQHLITCRVAADEYRFDGFQDVEVADFTEEQIITYAEKWFQDAPIKAEDFVEAIQDEANQGLHELCNSPLLLSLVCIYFDENMAFPQRRAELYQDALAILLRKWDSRRSIRRDTVYKNLSAQRKQQLLSHIATPAFEKGQYFFSNQELADAISQYLSRLPIGEQVEAEDIDGEVVLRAIAAQHGLLVERATGIYSFSHLTFHEYFTARYIVEEEARGAVKRLANRQIQDRRWREVFLLVASMLNQGDDLAKAIVVSSSQLLSNWPTLAKIIEWAHERTTEVNPSASQRYVVLSAYIFLSQAVARMQESVLEQVVELAKTQTQIQALALANALAKTQTDRMVIARAMAQTLEPALALAKIRALALEVNQTVNLALEEQDIVMYREQDLAIVEQTTENKSMIMYQGQSISAEQALVMAKSVTLAVVKSISEAIDLALAMTRVQELAQKVHIDVGLDYGLFYMWFFAETIGLSNEDFFEYVTDIRNTFVSEFAKLLELCNQAGMASLSMELSGLVSPDDKSPQYEWQRFASQLSTLMQNFRQFQMDWSFTLDELVRLDDYFYANELLVQCLNLAYVHDREHIMEQMFLLPKQNDSA